MIEKKRFEDFSETDGFLPIYVVRVFIISNL